LLKNNSNSDILFSWPNTNQIMAKYTIDNKKNITYKNNISNNININRNNQDNKGIYIKNTALTSSIQKAKFKVRRENALRLAVPDAEKREIYQIIQKSWRTKSKSNCIMR